MTTKASSSLSSTEFLWRIQLHTTIFRISYFLFNTIFLNDAQFTTNGIDYSKKHKVQITILNHKERADMAESALSKMRSKSYALRVTLKFN